MVKRTIAAKTKYKLKSQMVQDRTITNSVWFPPFNIVSLLFYDRILM